MVKKKGVNLLREKAREGYLRVSSQARPMTDKTRQKNPKIYRLKIRKETTLRSQCFKLIKLALINCLKRIKLLNKKNRKQLTRIQITYILTPALKQ